MDYWLSVNGVHPLRGTLCWVTDGYDIWLARRSHNDIPEKSVWIPLNPTNRLIYGTVTHYQEVEIPALPPRRSS